MASAIMMPNLNTIDATASTTNLYGVATTTEVVVAEAPKTVGEQVQEYFKDSPIMIKVAWCESRNRQFEKDGVTPFTGRINQSDVGVMQINKYYHLDTAKKMGLDLNTIDGNMAYAKYLYGKEGTTPWNSSSPCWAKGGNPVVAAN
ncbi:MAG: hypothetical protein JWP09_189 [Candidatus Taylorbacteria bacterium]|nr:hypothetical protein [Candidatus Taylorbacteria bacterium]